jgi:hypothetical protein
MLALRGFLITLYLILFFAFTVIFGVRLRRWDDSVAGRCYNPQFISHSTAKHPTVDLVYLGITFAYVCLLFFTTLSTRVREDELKSGGVVPIDMLQGLKNLVDEDIKRLSGTQDLAPQCYDRLKHRPDLPLMEPPNPVVLAMMQYPLHLYSAIALRISNANLFADGSKDEDSWGFGQILAVALVLENIVQCISGYLGILSTPSIT